jgi:hypothetical protein
MNSQFNLDLLDDDRRPGRHRKPEPGPEPEKPPLPSWVEPPNTFDLGLVGEVTRILPAVQSLPMPLEPRPETAVVVLSHRPKRNPFAGLLAWLPFGRPTR